MDETTTSQPEVEPAPELALSGMDLLRTAFTAPPADVQPEGTDTEPELEQTQDSGETAGAPTTAPPEWSEEDLGRALTDPRVVSQLQQFIVERDAMIRRQFELEQSQARAREEEALLSDEELGARVRATASQAPLVTAAQAQGYARAQQDMIRLGIGDVWESVPELKEMSPAERAALDPMNPKFRSMGSYFNALVDVAADRRAEKAANQKAKVLADAMVKDRLAKARKDTPGTQGPTGQGQSVRNLIDVNRMSGREILDRAFS